MIVTTTPYRISFFGGGTDYRGWFEEHGGQVLAGSINRYCHLSCRNFPPFFEFKYRVVWSEIEKVNDTRDIQHPAVRAAIEYMELEQGLEIHHNGDLPARAGLGSSSSFAVGILHAFHALKGEMVSKTQLANEAIYLEQILLQENVGIQDQITAAFGGFNTVNIDPGGNFQVNPIPIAPGRLRELESHLMLFYTGISRTASEIAKQQIEAIPDKTPTLHEMAAMVPQAVDVLTGGGDIKEFGRMLHETWLLKRSITPSISNSEIDELYNNARAAGAIGGKLLGAGGGGFVAIFAEPEMRQSVLDALSNYLVVPFEFEQGGSRITVYEPEQYSTRALADREFKR
jgi:D-glycero-alpha-D-manno-heptose-7-phosphate kinase